MHAVGTCRRTALCLDTVQCVLVSLDAYIRLLTVKQSDSTLEPTLYRRPPPHMEQTALIHIVGARLRSAELLTPFPTRGQLYKGCCVAGPTHRQVYSPMLALVATLATAMSLRWSTRRAPKLLGPLRGQAAAGRLFPLVRLMNTFNLEG